MEERGKKMDNLRKLMGFVRPYIKRLGLALVMTVMLTMTGMITPLIAKYVVDRVIVEGRWEMLEIVLFISIMIPLTTAGLRMLNTYTISYISHKLIMDIRLEMYRHLLRLPLRFYDEMGTGRVMARIMGDVASVRSMVTRRLLTMVTNFVTFWVAVVLCFTLSWKLGLLLTVLLPLYILNHKIFIGGIRTTWRQWRAKMDEVSIGLQERLAGVQLVKSYGRERRENRAFVEDTRDSLDFAMRSVVYEASRSTGAWVVSGLRNTLVFCLGCYFVIQGEMTYGALMAFQAYAMRMFHPVIDLMNTITQFERMMVSVDRIYEVLNWEVDIKDKPGAADLPPIQGHVKFENVWFEYTPGEPVLKGINLEIPSGTMVALVGHTGCGKTTLTSLMMRFYDVTQGRITIDGHDIQDVALRSLRTQIGQVLQDSVLFNSSIKENLCYGHLDASEEEVIASAWVGEIHEFVMRTSQGYDTPLGDEGVKLSVGEKQRLAIARAVLIDPAILILDEATSSLDSLSEALIQKAMTNVMKGRTSFVIAHRLSTIINADLIVVMEHGEIMEMGSHEDLLLKPDGKYRQLYEKQYAGFQEEEAEVAAG